MGAARHLLSSSRSLGVIELDFGALTPGSLAAASMPTAGATSNRSVLTRSSVATVRKSLATMETGIGIDIPRIEQFDDDTTHRGLLLEERKQALLSFMDDLSVSSSSGWAAGGTTLTRTANYGTGPHGSATGNTRMQRSGTGVLNQSNGQVGVGASLHFGDYVTYAGWFKGTSGVDALDFEVQRSTTGSYYVGGPVGTPWRRICLIEGYLVQTPDINVTGPGVYAVGDGVVFTAPSDIQVCFLSAEKGKFATSQITVTTSCNLPGSEIYRSGERFYLPDASYVVRSGRLQMRAYLYPLGNANHYAPTGITETRCYLFKKADTAGGANEAYISRGDQKLTVTINGTSWSPPEAIAWGAYNLVEFWLECGANGVARFQYSRNGGYITTLSGGFQLPALDPSGTIDLFCNGVTGQWTSVINKVQFWPTSRPSTFDLSTTLTSSTVLADFTAAAASSQQAGDFVNTPFEDSYPGFRFAHATGSRTVQTGVATMDEGIAANFALFGRETATSGDLGLIVERGCINSAKASQALGAWTIDGSTVTLTVTTNDTTGPSGASDAERVQWSGAAGQKRVYPTVTASGATNLTSSIWVKGGVTNNDNVELLDVNGNGLYTTITGSTKTWNRVQGTRSADGYIGLRNVSGTLPDIWAVKAQKELGQFATEYHPTADAGATTVTRAGGRLFYRRFYALTDGGALSLLLQHRPKGGPAHYSDSTMTAVIQILYVDASNQVYIDKTARTVTVVIGGASITSSATIGASDWVRGDTVEWWIQAGALPTGVKYRVNGGSWFTLLDRNATSALGTIPLDSTTIGPVDIFSKALTEHFSSRVQKITKYARGERPSGT